jgi:hypothetical protein
VIAPSGSADAKNARFTTACIARREPLDCSEDDYSVAESPERAQTPGPREGVGGDGAGVLGLTGRGVRETPSVRFINLEARAQFAATAFLRASPAQFIAVE